MASALQLDVTNIRLNDYVSLVVLTAVGYDYILTFSREIKYIWNQPWTRVSTIFVFSRYFGLCNLIINALVGSSFVPGPSKTYVVSSQWHFETIYTFVIVAVYFISLAHGSCSPLRLMNRYMYLLAWEGLVYFLAVLSYALTAMLLDMEIVPRNGWPSMLLVPLHFIPTFTLVPRFILDLRELYARDLHGRRGNIDTGFGFISESGDETAVSTIAFADVPRCDGEERVNEIQMQVRGLELRSGCASST